MNHGLLLIRCTITAILVASVVPMSVAQTFLAGEIAAHMSNQNVLPSVAVHPNDDTFVTAYKLGDQVFVDQWDGMAWNGLTSFLAADVGSIVLGDDLHIIIDPNGNLHIVFIAYAGTRNPSTPRDVYYGFYDMMTMGWAFQLVERYSNSNGHVNPDNPQVGWNTISNSPELLWTVSNASNSISPSPNHSLKYAVPGASVPWDIQTIQTAEGPGSALNNAAFTVGTDGVTHTSFMQRDPHDGMVPTMLMNDMLMYGNNSTGSFVLAPIVVGSAMLMPGKANSIDLDPAQKVHIAYYDYFNDALHYTSNQSGAFVDQVVDSKVGTDIGRRCVIDVNAKNDILIAYQDHTNGKLKAAFMQNGDPWDIIVVANDGVQNARFVGAAYADSSEVMLVHDAKLADLDKRLLFGFVGPCQPTAAPTGVQATDGTSNQVVRITWDAVPEASEYRIYRSTMDDSMTAQLIGTTVDLTFDDINANPPSRVALNQLGTAGSGGQSISGALPIAMLGLCFFVTAAPMLGLRERKGQSSLGRAARAGFSVLILVALVQLPTACIPPTPTIQTYYYWVQSSNTCGVPSAFSASDSGYRSAAKVTSPDPVETDQAP